jgi:hypothetical protein
MGASPPNYYQPSPRLGAMRPYQTKSRMEHPAGAATGLSAPIRPLRGRIGAESPCAAKGLGGYPTVKKYLIAKLKSKTSLTEPNLPALSSKTPTVLKAKSSLCSLLSALP